MEWHGLAKYLGMSRRRAQLEISSEEFEDWRTYRRIVPDPDDERIARVCAVMARLGGSKTLTEADFLPNQKQAPVPGQEIKRRIKSQLLLVSEALRNKRRATANG